ncbi:Protein of unknown function [Malonomonas rubra DSM 5091]|uniref:DUF4019 domain-containing protein n=1 Tax=Malonomonas rubra DSM 5091 TaxID=1122189 RepID=A0A1M6IN97_MALRU|nr:DUF4019 domain-containing protein [Malonomonas rubra]SHJ35898.1 Protein of unknown function [Malonomonas rubra DSM 5091]
MFARKYRIHIFLILIALGIIYVSYTNNLPKKEQIQVADAAAQEFLQMVDAGRYDDSWVIAAPYLRQEIPQEKWLQELTDLRTKVGKLNERSLEDANFTAAIKEMPDSVLMLLEYTANYEKGVFKEMITLIRESDTRWRVVGYFIQ